MKIDTTEPPTNNPQEKLDALNYCIGLKRLACFSDARMPENVAPALGISERTLIRWRENGCPCYKKYTPNGQSAFHYCGQELLFWILKRQKQGIEGIEFPERITQYMELFIQWQKAHVKAGNFEEVIPAEAYEESGRHYQFMIWLWYDSEIMADVSEAIEGYGCPILIDEEKLETRAFQIWSYEQRKAWPTD
jgi:hypothetical protein